MHARGSTNTNSRATSQAGGRNCLVPEIELTVTRKIGGLAVKPLIVAKKVSECDSDLIGFGNAIVLFIFLRTVVDPTARLPQGTDL
jgi:hypothetical protein